MEQAIGFKTNKAKAYAASVTATVLFGFSFLFLKIALEQNGGHVFDVLSYRFLISIIGLCLLWATRVIRLDFKEKNLKSLLFMCLLNPVLYFTLEIAGVSRVASSEAGMMLSVLPVVTILFGRILLHERISVWQGVFIALSICGILLIQVMSYRPGDSSNLGRLILLGAIIAGSAYSVTSRKIARHFSPIERTAAMTIVGGLTFTTLSWVNRLSAGTLRVYFENITRPGLLLPVLYLGLGCSLLAFFLLNYAVTHLEVSRTSVLANLATIVSIIAGAVFLNETIRWYHLIGSAVIIAGVIGANRMVPNRFGQAE